MQTDMLITRAASATLLFPQHLNFQDFCKLSFTAKAFDSLHETGKPMIAPSEHTSCEGVPELEDKPADFIVLARYGRVPQVARFLGYGEALTRGTRVIVSTDRGQETADVLQVVPVHKSTEAAETTTGEVLRPASDEDLSAASANEQKAESEYPGWLTRAAGWKLQLELVDLEITLDGRLILYVLNDRGAETTRMALLAAAAGFGIVHVQPVSADGIVQASGGGCGTCGTHAH